MKKSAILFLTFLQIVTASSCKKNNALLKIHISDAIKSGASGTTSGMKYGKMTDIDGNVYKTIQIGKQIWMAENLKVSKYRNGTPIPKGNYSSFGQNKSGSYYFFNDDAQHNLTYGKLYNGYSVFDQRGLAPKGWHIPTSSEWAQLINYVGGVFEAGGKLKTTGIFQNGTGLWVYPNAGATDTFGFSAIPHGFLYASGYTWKNKDAHYWSSTIAPTNTEFAGYFYISADHTAMYGATQGGYDILDNAYGIRCVKD